MIFAKAYFTGEWYVGVAGEMPRLTAAEIEEQAKSGALRGGRLSGKFDSCIFRSIPVRGNRI